MDDILPDIEAFKPWEMNHLELDDRIICLQKELQALHDSDKNYKVDLIMGLDLLVRQQKMRLYCETIEKNWK